MRIRLPFVVGLAAALAGCALSPDDVPTLTGPSELALSLALGAHPDLLAQDGAAQSTITVVARDARGRPISGLTLRLTLVVDGASFDDGILSSKTISTDSSGAASAIYTAPMPPPPTATDDATVDIQVVPIGSDFSNAVPRVVSIRLVRGGLILPPNPELVPRFIFSPTEPHEGDPVEFDASTSSGAIAAYEWTFGDGTAGSGVRVTHRYAMAGTFNVVLAATDDRGAHGQATPAAVTIAAAPGPVAVFTISPGEPAVGQTVHVDGSAATAAPGHAIVSYAWTFGDGVSGGGQTSDHAYGQADTYTIGLVVTDDLGRRGTASKTVEVK